MKISVILSTFAAAASAFPHLAPEALDSAKVADASSTLRQRQLLPPPFDAKSQLVSTSGKYAFVEPGPTDARGPCPGLNAAANHGYLPHNGVADVRYLNITQIYVAASDGDGQIEQFITGTYQVFGMAADLAGFLAVYGAVFNGNLAGWSIGGPTNNLPSIGLLGTPTGMSGSHNKYENDASPIRGDLYTFGEDYKSHVKYFQQFYDLQAGVPDDKANFDLDVITAHRAARFEDSIKNNGYFFNAPFSGIVASPAAYAFIYRFMANKSAEYPEGRLDRYSLKSFYAISGESGNFTYTPGHERIPENWYKRNDADQYTIPFYSTDAIAQIIAHPVFASLGGNTGKPNTFTGIDFGNLTGGIFNGATLAEGNNLICFGFQASLQQAPDLLEGLFTDVTKATNLLSGAINKATNGLGCPQLTTLQYSQFNKFPGYSKSYAGYKAPSGS